MVHRSALETSCRQTTLSDKTASWKLPLLQQSHILLLSWAGSPILRCWKSLNAYSFMSCTKLSQCKMKLYLLPMIQTFMGLLQCSQRTWIEASQMQECKVSSVSKTQNMISNNCIITQLLQNSSSNLYSTAIVCTGWTAVYSIRTNSAATLKLSAGWCLKWCCFWRKTHILWINWLSVQNWLTGWVNFDEQWSVVGFSNWQNDFVFRSWLSKC